MSKERTYTEAEVKQLMYKTAKEFGLKSFESDKELKEEYKKYSDETIKNVHAGDRLLEKGFHPYYVCVQTKFGAYAEQTVWAKNGREAF